MAEPRPGVTQPSVEAAAHSLLSGAGVYRRLGVVLGVLLVPALSFGAWVALGVMESGETGAQYELTRRALLISLGVSFMLFTLLAVALAMAQRSAVRGARLLRGAFERLARSEESLSRAQQIARVGSWDWNIATNELAWSDEIYRIFGLTPRQFGATYDAFLERVAPDDRERVSAAVRAAVEHDTPYDIEHRISRPGGAIRVVREQGEVYRDGQGKPLRMVGAVQDITDRVQYQSQLALSAEVFENAIEGVLITDAHGVIQTVNRAFTAITGYTREEAVGQRPNLLRSNRHDKEFYGLMWAELLREGRWQGEIWNRRKNGEAYPEWLTIVALRDAEGRATQFVSVFHDISETKRAEERLSYHTNYDALTGLPNRALLMDRLARGVAHAHHTGGKLAALLVDLDHFKIVNDSLGPVAGDLMLQEVAARLKQTVGEDDTVARAGADEFMIVMPALAAEEEAAGAARRAIEALARPFHLEGNECFITASVGITFYPADGGDAQTLMKNADIAMFRAKEAGRNGYQIFLPEMNLRVTSRLRVESDLRRAIERGEFVPHFQAKASLATGGITGAEALARWIRADGSMASPAEFIPVAEETGLIVPLGELVLASAAARLAAWERAGTTCPSVAVNLSPKQFASPGLIGSIRRIIEASGLAASRFDFEITESALLGDMDMAVNLLRQLREMGAHVSLDDFGTGYSSLSYLTRLPINSVKIDRSFIAAVPGARHNELMVASIIGLAKNLSLTVVAEGVETRAQLDLLRGHGCDEMQGYFFSKPRAPEDFFLFLKEGRRLPLD
ncbi:MAG: EAL domain-containing protein [Nitrospinae bacterium]|nr:EAL domain-containing protein [Nitrospinota bacterium]